MIQVLINPLSPFINHLTLLANRASIHDSSEQWVTQLPELASAVATHTRTIPAFTPQPQGDTALWLVFIAPTH